MVIFHSYVHVYQRVKAGSHGIPMSGSAARLLLSTLAPWEPMCRRFQETNGGPGQWLQEWGHYHRFRKGKKPSRDEYISYTSPKNRILWPLSTEFKGFNMYLGHVLASIFLELRTIFLGYDATQREPCRTCKTPRPNPAPWRSTSERDSPDVLLSSLWVATTSSWDIPRIFSGIH